MIDNNLHVTVETNKIFFSNHKIFIIIMIKIHHNNKMYSVITKFYILPVKCILYNTLGLVSPCNWDFLEASL